MYSDLAASLNECKFNPAVRGLATDAYDDYLTNQLQISAGANADQETVYRPYYVAAKFLEQLRTQQTIRKADGAEFTGLALPIASLMGLQSSIDQSLGLTVPPGFEAIAITLDGSIGNGLWRYGTRSLTTQPRP